MIKIVLTKVPRLFNEERKIFSTSNTEIKGYPHGKTNKLHPLSHSIYKN